jgi:hypothetical protein
MPKDMEDDLIEELWYAIYDRHPNSVFSTTVKFKNDTIVFYFRDDEELTGNNRWAVGVFIESLCEIPKLPSIIDDSKAPKGKIVWVNN